MTNIANFKECFKLLQRQQTATECLVTRRGDGESTRNIRNSNFVVVVVVVVVVERILRWSQRWSQAAGCRCCLWHACENKLHIEQKKMNTIIMTPINKKGGVRYVRILTMWIYICCSHNTRLIAGQITAHHKQQ